MRSARRAAFLVGSIVAALGRVAGAQDPSILLSAGSTPSVHVRPGDRLTVPITVDVSHLIERSFASLAANVTWSFGRLTLDSIRPGDLGSLTSNASAGSASLAMLTTNSFSTGTTIANLYFTAGTIGGTRVHLAPVEAGDATGSSLMEFVHTRDVDVCVAPIGQWGDANGDGDVNIIDAQQLARYAIELGVANPTAVAAQGDVNGSGTPDIGDAQQIARFSIGLSASPRLGTTLPLIPPITSVSVGPGEPTLGVGETLQFTATPRDETGAHFDGCVDVDWTSDTPAHATVSATGLVTGMGAGPVTITAKAGGRVATTSFDVFVPVAFIQLTPFTDMIHVGEQLQLTAVARDQNENPLDELITFGSSDPNAATVSSNGLVTGKNAGPVTIIAASQQRTASMTIQIAPAAENALAVGDAFGCALTQQGIAYCWGSNAAGQLGDGSTTSSSVPVQVAAPPSVRFNQITAGGSSACGVSTKGVIYCWGAGIGNALTPSPVSGALFLTTASAGTGFGCALDESGNGYCIGSGTGGHLGNGNTISSSVPVAVSGGLTFRSVSSGLFSSCGLTAAGAASCWGDNSFKTLGIAGAPANSLVPALVTGGLTFTSVNVGGIMTCGVTTTSTAYCWGSPLFGAAGDGTTNTLVLTAPTVVASGLAFRSVFPGTGNDILDSVCGLVTDGTAYCWGSNSSGQIGTSTSPLPGSCTFNATPFSCTGTPTLVTTAEKFAVIRLGAEQACGLTMSRTLLCWGRNTSGQLGDGTLLNRSTPVPVLGGLVVP